MAIGAESMNHRKICLVIEIDSKYFLMMGILLPNFG
jgi:hypothetical protein